MILTPDLEALVWIGAPDGPVHPGASMVIPLQAIVLINHLVVHLRQQLKVVDVVHATRPHAGRQAVLITHIHAGTVLNQQLK